MGKLKCKREGYEKNKEEKEDEKGKGREVDRNKCRKRQKTVKRNDNDKVSETTRYGSCDGLWPKSRTGSNKVHTLDF